MDIRDASAQKDADYADPFKSQASISRAKRTRIDRFMTLRLYVIDAPCLFPLMKRALFLLFLSLFLAAVLSASPASATVRITIDLGAQRLTAEKGGQTVSWKISSGRAGYETPTGHYSVMRMEADHLSDEYDKAPMPYAIFFSPRGLAIHGTFEGGLGRARSHGCVRLAVGNARQLFEWVEQQGGATIDIVGQTRVAASRRAEPEDQPRRTNRHRDHDFYARQPAIEEISGY